MDKNSEQRATQDILQTSELTARLLRRLTDAQGVIETTMLRQVLARLAGWAAHRGTLFDDLMARYRLDDGSVDVNGPLVMEQPWTLNINAYLTSDNSSSSTINQFISAVASSQAITASKERSSSRFEKLSEASPSIAAPAREAGPTPSTFSSNATQAWQTPLIRSSGFTGAQTMPSKGTASLPPPMKFRISRNPARRAWDPAPEDVQGIVRSFISKSAEGADEKSERTTSIASPSAVRGDLPFARTHLAQSEIERESDDALTAAAFTERRSASLAKDLKKRDNEANENIMLRGDGPGIDGMTRSATSSHPNYAIAPTETSRSTVPPIQIQVAAAQAKRQPPNLIWRKGADISSATNPIAAATSGSPTQFASQTAGQASMVKSPRSQDIANDVASRKDEPRAGRWPTTERILRNISRKLLIERERRGY